MPGLSPSLTAHNSLRHPTSHPPPRAPHSLCAGPQISVQTLGWVPAAGGAGHIALCWPKGCPAAAALPPQRGTDGLFPGISSPRPGAGAVSSPALLLCRYCPLKTTPRRSFPRPHSEAAWTCLPEFSVFNSLFQWGLHLAWNIQKGYPNSFYHGGPPLLPAAPPPHSHPQRASCLEHVSVESKLPTVRTLLPRAPLRWLWGSEGHPVPATP